MSEVEQAPVAVETPVVGVKETQELILGGLSLGFYLARLAKDGIDFNDLTAFLNKLSTDQVFAQKMKDAYDGADQISAEIKDLTLQEVLQLAGVVIPAAIAEITALQALEVKPAA